MPCEVFLKSQLRSASSIALLGSGKVELVALGVHFENFVSLRSPVPGLLVFLVIDVELVQEILDIPFVLDIHNAILEVLSEVHNLVSVSLSWWISASSAA